MVALAELVMQTDDAEQHSWIGDTLVARANQNMHEKDAGLLLPVMARVQVERAQYFIGQEDDDGALSVLSTGYRRAPNERALSQLYADRLYEAGEIVEAGNIYDHTVMPTFVFLYLLESYPYFICKLVLAYLKHGSTKFNSFSNMYVNWIWLF